MTRFLAICTVKNEGAFFLEWLAWARLIGFTDFLIFQNDSKDGTKELLQLLSDNKLIQFVDNDGAQFASPQRYSYRQAAQSEMFAAADWAMALDVDEFPVISVGKGKLNHLLAAYPEDIDEIRLNWVNFGNDGHVGFAPKLVTERFRSRSPVSAQKANRIPTKTLFRRSSFARLGVHSPLAPTKDNVVSFDGSGNLLSSERRVGYNDPQGQKLAAVYHYIVKDIANFVLKCDRGKSGHPNREMKARYWRHWAPKNPEKSDAMASKADLIRDEIRKIDALCQGRALKLQQNAYSWREKRFSELMEQHEYVEMMRDICKYEGVPFPDFLNINNSLDIVESSAIKKVAAAPARSGPNLNFSKIKEITLASGGEFHETENYVVAHVPGDGRLVVGFDNLSSIKSDKPRMPWSFDLAREQGWGVLGVMVKANDWYQSPDLYPVMEGMRDRGLFSKYPKVTMYGASMGAFGAATFARLAPDCTVVAMAPQSSLASDLVPFETRYRFARRRVDWSSGAYRDAAEGIKFAGKTYLMCDPLIEMDCLHVARLTRENTIVLRWNFLTHKIPPALNRMNILKPMALEMIEGTMTEERFTELMSNRKNCVAYLVRMLDGARMRGHYKLGLSAVAQARKTKDNWRLRQVERNMRREFKEQRISQKV